jgi:2-polyprenyl-6-methoxyphenol hydroxylase-like FAD-dependent oxidoreductase
MEAAESWVGVVRVARHAVVVGGGIGGLAAAVALGGAGWEVTVLERAAELAEVGAGVSLWPNGLRALGSIDPGLVQVLRDRWALRGVAGVRSAGGRWLVRLDASWIEQRYGIAVLLVARPELHSRLAGLVPAGAVRLGCTVRDVRSAGWRAVVTGLGPADGFGIETDLVVAADGVHSYAARAGGRPTLMFLTKEATRLAIDVTAVGVASDGCPSR